MDSKKHWCLQRRNVTNTKVFQFGESPFLQECLSVDRTASLVQSVRAKTEQLQLHD